MRVYAQLAILGRGQLQRGQGMNHFNVAIGIIVAIVVVSVYLGVTDNGPSEHFTSGANVLAR